MSSINGWQAHPEHFIVVHDYLPNHEGKVYHIFDVENNISHIIEDQVHARDIAEKMIAAGVRVVTLAEAMKMLHPPRSQHIGAPFNDT